MTEPAHTAELYTIRPEGTFEWAHIVVDERTGLFVAHGGFGTFGYCWTHIGKQTLKQFLAGLEYDYFFGKVADSRGRMFCPEATLRVIRELIVERRRGGGLDKGSAREAWDELGGMSAPLNPHEFMAELDDCPAVMKALRYDLFDLARDRRDPKCVGFWEQIWPEFLAAIAEPADG